MIWEKKYVNELTWNGEITHYEQKMSLAKQVAQKAGNGDVIGFGSGSTSFLIVHAIAGRIREEGLKVSAIPTSPEIKMACHSLEIPVDSLTHVRPDWSFDGADEVDKDNNLIKGRGGAMFMEKILMCCSDQNYIVVDRSKIVDTLGEKFPVPIEINPEALVYVRKALSGLGASEIIMRLAKAKDGPVVTECGNFILDVRFQHISRELEKEIKSITGVIESGLFIGYPVDIITL
jgi:ribose 5-phosphate isomerase A